jgi:nicotinamide mononucleotide transporter
MSLFEIVAAALGITSVFFSTRQNTLAWPTSLLNNAMYFVLFLGQQLYALMALQLFFGAIAVYGWYEWRFGGAAKTELKVSRIPPPLGAALGAIALAGTLLLWFVLRRYTPDPHPLIDAFFFAVSLVAQWMMARKYFECWPVWVAINCIAVPFFFLQHSYPTMVQYGVFLVLAIMGWRQWFASLESAPSANRGAERD